MVTSDQLVNTQNIKGNAPFMLVIHREAEDLVDLKFWRLAAFSFCHGSIELTCLLYLWSLSILTFWLVDSIKTIIMPAWHTITVSSIPNE